MIKVMKQTNSYIKEINEITAQIIELYESWAKQKNIQYSHFLVLYVLIEQEKVTQKQLSERCHLIKQTVNVITKNLLNEGYISFEQSPDNKKEKLITLTRTGYLYAHSVVDELLEIEEAVAEKAGTETLQLLISSNRTFKEILQKEMEKFD